MAQQEITSAMREVVADKPGTYITLAVSMFARKAVEFVTPSVVDRVAKYAYRCRVNFRLKHIPRPLAVAVQNRIGWQSQYMATLQRHLDTERFPNAETVFVRALQAMLMEDATHMRYEIVSTEFDQLYHRVKDAGQHADTEDVQRALLLCKHMLPMFEQGRQVADAVLTCLYNLKADAVCRDPLFQAQHIKTCFRMLQSFYEYRVEWYEHQQGLFAELDLQVLDPATVKARADAEAYDAGDLHKLNDIDKYCRGGADVGFVLDFEPIPPRKAAAPRDAKSAPPAKPAPK